MTTSDFVRFVEDMVKTYALTHEEKQILRKYEDLEITLESSKELGHIFGKAVGVLEALNMLYDAYAKDGKTSLETPG